ncbi:hypothetical protein BD626DRAFT_509687 [Schizophyllum amplum]|uniref:Indoleamine 2,3-dioxygenase n=1 Tax=Schizophyllum amplum TaxID=97359 RepID=A0A550C2Q3_9AGAR|nr:hypothetical protein BD626DRAFT_509687 [Auriculariopsis ampla]
MLSYLYSFWAPREEVLTADNVERLVGKCDHEAVARLTELVEVGGGGCWPPRATYEDTWPFCLRPYEAIYHEVAPHMTVAESCLDDEQNRLSIDAFRDRLSTLLSQRIDLDSVEDALLSDERAFPPPAWMGFFACIGFLRHAYRWGVVPIVREAQNELTLTFPEQLQLPWVALQQRYGVTSSGGNLTSNVYANYSEPLTLHFPVNAALPGVHLKTEQWNSRMFYAMEEKAMPMYRLMALSIGRLDTGDSAGTLRALAAAGEILRDVLRFFYDNLKDENLSTPLWMAYTQGFHGWTLDGTDGVEALHLPSAQRNWLNYLREYDIRTKASQRGDAAVVEALEKMVSQLRVWRMGHMRRMMPYEGVPRPERKNMTAGKSVVDADLAPDESAMVEHLKAQLAQRLSETH